MGSISCRTKPMVPSVARITVRNLSLEGAGVPLDAVEGFDMFQVHMRTLFVDKSYRGFVRQSPICADIKLEHRQVSKIGISWYHFKFFHLNFLFPHRNSATYTGTRAYFYVYILGWGQVSLPQADLECTSSSLAPLRHSSKPCFTYVCPQYLSRW